MLKDLREKQGMSQSQLAEKADINRRTLQDYEQGRRDLNKAQAIVIYQLSKALGCNMEDLINKG